MRSFVERHSSVRYSGLKELKFPQKDKIISTAYTVITARGPTVKGRSLIDTGIENGVQARTYRSTSTV